MNPEQRPQRPQRTNRPNNLQSDKKTNSKWLAKRNYPLRVKSDFRAMNKRITALFLALIIIVAVFRVGWITIVERERYRGLAETTSYKEVEVEAKRGSIYASDMTALARSYPVWTLAIDPVHLHSAVLEDCLTTNYNVANGGKKKIDKDLRTKLREEIWQKYVNRVVDFLCLTLNEGLKPADKDYVEADDLLKKFTTLTKSEKGKTDSDSNSTAIRYVVIRENVTAEMKMKLDDVLDECYYNYVLDSFVEKHHVEEQTEEQPEQSIVKKVLNRIFPSKNKGVYFYDYKTKTSVFRTDLTDVQSSCILSEYGSFTFEEKSVRTYANDGLCSSFMGYIDKDGNAMYGLEQYYDQTLSGKNGKISGLAVNNNGVMVQSSDSVVNEARDGDSLVLTIDQGVQHILEDNLKSAYERYSAEETFGVVMDVNTGAVIGMSDYPNYDLNNPRKITAKKSALEKAKTQLLLENESNKNFDDNGNVTQPTKNQIETRARQNQWSNFCVSYPYELGSTFKLFTASAGIEEGIATPDTNYYCGGTIKVIDKDMSCSHKKNHNTLSMRTAIAKSCNIYFIRLGQNLGKDTFNKYFNAFGFGEKTGIDTLGESKGTNKSNDKMTYVELSSTAFGQTATITPIQLITAASAIANGGKLLTPHFVDRIIDSEGNIVKRTEVEEKRVVVSKETCDKVKEMMKGVVYSSDGTAYGKINVEGYTIAGKTGSGEIQGQGGSTGSNGYKYTASFVGFAPADDPEIAILVGIRNPKGGYLSGGEIAAPVAGNVLSYALSALDIQSPDGNKINGKAPNVVDSPLLTAKAKISDGGYIYKVYGGGSTVISQNPEAGTPMPESGVVAIFTDNVSHGIKTPDFEGLTKPEALALARETGINISCQNWRADSDVIVDQSDSAGKTVQPGKIITVKFSDEAS